MSSRKRKSDEPHDQQQRPPRNTNPPPAFRVRCRGNGASSKDRPAGPRSPFRTSQKDSLPTSAPIGYAPIRPYVRPGRQNPPIIDYTQVPTAWNPDDYDIPE